MNDANRYLGIDIGASGGTLYTGRFLNGTLELNEVGRFDNNPSEEADRYVWDIDALLENITEGIEACHSQYGPIDSIGIDTWGTDFGFLSDGELLRKPYSYRDPRLTSTREELFDTVGRRALFEATGICHWQTATSLYHLHYLLQEEPSVIEQADTLLMIPQLLSALLGGAAVGEETVVSTTQMIDPEIENWAEDLLTELNVPLSVLPDIKPPGEVSGSLSAAHAPDSENQPDIVLPASHDTASAVSALPLVDENRLFLSTGTMFLPGIELGAPNRTEQAFEISASNELGLDDSIRFTKNMNGFFLLEEARKAWNAAGENTAYDVLLSKASKTTPRGPLVDPDHGMFDLDAEIPAKIREYCSETGQEPPSGTGEVTQCILESLVVKTALAFDQLESTAGRTGSRIHLGGGGVRNQLLCQLLADVTGKTVVAGPAEAAVIGNLLSQAIGRNDVSSLAAGRGLVKSSFAFDRYRPDDTATWEGVTNEMADLIAAAPSA